MERILKLVCVVACAPLLAAASGCLAVAAVGGAAAGAGAVSYYYGRYEQTMDAPLAKVHNAAVAAVKAQGLELKVDKEDKVTGRLESEYADGKHVWIDLLAEANDRTKVSVRVGLVPDRDRALAILQSIKKKL